MKKLVSILMIASLFSIEVIAQNEIDALRYSRLNYSGSARFVAMGGAFGALGADFTTLSHNPAGIGLYRSSEISFTPSLSIANSEATFYGRFRDDSKYSFNFGSAGIVMVTKPSANNQQSMWKNVQFGFGINRMANFNNRIMIEGFNNESSYLTHYRDHANKYNDDPNDKIAPENLDDFTTGLAYDADLLFKEYNYDSTFWNYQVDLPNGGVNQRKSIDTKGSINEMVFSFGANYGDRLYMGATIGIPYIRYSETSVYTETDVEGNSDYFDSFTRTDNLETSGTGINFKFGLIYRASDWLRFGGAVHTPTFYSSMTDNYNTTFKSNFDGSGYSAKSPEGFFEYELNTPFRAIGGLAFIIGKAGLISADYEFVDYATARLRAPAPEIDDANEIIRTIYLSTNNLRFGTEWRYGSLNLRGGYSISGNPYKNGSESINSSYSLGLGIREKSFFIDLAWMYSQMDEEYYLYSTDYVAPVEAKLNNSLFLMTIGFKY